MNVNEQGNNYSVKGYNAQSFVPWQYSNPVYSPSNPDSKEQDFNRGMYHSSYNQDDYDKEWAQKQRQENQSNELISQTISESQPVSDPFQFGRDAQARVNAQNLGIAQATLAALQICAKLREQIINLYNETTQKLQALDQQQSQNQQVAILSLTGTIQATEENFNNDAIQINDGVIIDKSGLISDQQLNTDEGLRLKKRIIGWLGQNPNFTPDKDVIQILNLSLASFNNPTIRKSEIMGSAGLALSAQLALNDRNKDAYESFLKAASETVDEAYGFIPVAGPVNDLEQIVYGMATGYDYTGKPMVGSDYLYRGFSALIGMLPAGSQIFQFSTDLINKALLEGINLVRESNASLILQAASSAYHELATRILSILGTVYQAGHLPAELNLNANIIQAIKHLTPSLNPGGVEQVYQLCSMLEDAGIAVEDKIRVISSFAVGTIEFQTITDDIEVYRWHNNNDSANQFGRFFSAEEILNKNEARETLALPPQNKLRYLDGYNLPKSTNVFKGKIGPNFGYDGGGIQYFVPDNSKMTFLENLKHPFLNL